MAGINDIPAGSAGEPADAKNNLNALVKKIFDAKPGVLIMIARITPYASHTDALVRYNDYIRGVLAPQYAAQGKRIVVVDQYANFLTPSASINTSLYSNNFNHPNAAGYRKMADTWYSALMNSIGSSCSEEKR